MPESRFLMPNIHELGVRRHGQKWLFANQRAVEQLYGSQIKFSDPAIKETIAKMVLAVLDGAMLDRGMVWYGASNAWITRKEYDVFKALKS